MPAIRPVHSVFSAARVLALLALLAATSTAQASHFRSSSFAYEKTSGNTVRLQLTMAYRHSFFGSPAQGAIVPVETLHFGDGASTTLHLRVIAINSAEDFFIGESVNAGGGPLTHAYPGPGPWTASFSNCCYLSAVQNHPGGSYGSSIVLDLARSNRSPLSSVAPIVDVGSSGDQHFPVPALDPDQRALTWSLASPSPAGLAIDAATGRVSWNTTGRSLGLYAASDRIGARNTDGAEVAQSHVNYLIRIGSSANRAPRFVPPTPPQQGEFSVSPDEPLLIDIAADDDAGQTVNLGHLGLPAGASLAALPGNPASARLSWTPTAADIGDHLISFTARDNAGGNALARTVVVHVTGLDFGDAGGSYPSRLEDDGARHLTAGLLLGKGRDAEPDALAAENGGGDDLGGLDDEDGVSFGGPFVIGNPAMLSVQVTGGSGHLDAFFDWNGDGDWDDDEEHVAAAVLAGANALSIAAPYGSVAGPSQARFRLTSAVGSGLPIQAAPDGEVEDHPISLQHDVSPDAFDFADQQAVPFSSTRDSNTVVVAGISTVVPIAVSAGSQYRVNEGAYRADAGTVSRGDRVQLRHQSSASPGTAVTTTVSIGDRSDSFTSTTEPADITPDPFFFTDAGGAVSFGSPQLSDEITVRGINTAAPVTVTGGSYSVNGVLVASGTGTVVAGDRVGVRHVAASSFSTTTDTTLTIGANGVLTGVSDTYSSTTLAEDLHPDSFAFAAASNAPLLSIKQASAEIRGINSVATVTVQDGLIAVGAAPDATAFSAGPLSISDGQILHVRHQAASTPSTTTQARIRVGTSPWVSFLVTTVPPDTQPDMFSFTPVTDAQPLSRVSSNAVLIKGINAPSPVSVSGGEYSFAGSEAWTSDPGWVLSGQQLRVRQQAALSPGTTTRTVLTVGGVSAIFSSTTLGPAAVAVDSLPAQFRFTDRSGVAPEALVMSNRVTITGLKSGLSQLSISGGEYELIDGTWSSAPVLVQDRDRIRVRHTSAADPHGRTDTVLTIGGVSDTFSSTTRGGASED